MTTSEKHPEAPSGMLNRFTGEHGKARLLEALTETTLLRGIDNVADFAAGAELIEIPQGSAIIDQGSVDNDLYLILSGSFNIIINGRHTATRGVGSHVGEMALIDCAARRSATVVAAEHSLVLKCPEPHFNGGNPAHKRNPGDYGLMPPVQPRADKTLCDSVRVFKKSEAEALLREGGVRRGLVSGRMVNNFPQNIWAVTEEGKPLEGQLENPQKGVYHGYLL